MTNTGIDCMRDTGGGTAKEARGKYVLSVCIAWSDRKKKIVPSCGSSAQTPVPSEVLSEEQHPMSKLTAKNIPEVTVREGRRGFQTGRSANLHQRNSSEEGPRDRCSLNVLGPNMSLGGCIIGCRPVPISKHNRLDYPPSDSVLKGRAEEALQGNEQLRSRA